MPLTISSATQHARLARRRALRVRNKGILHLNGYISSISRLDRKTRSRVVRTRAADDDGDAARSMLNLAMSTPGNSSALWNALIDYGAEIDEVLISEMCAAGNAPAVRCLIARTEKSTPGDSRSVLRLSGDQMCKAIRSGSDRTVKYAANHVARCRKEMTAAEWRRVSVGLFPLHEAVRSGTTKMLLDLLRARADTRSVDDSTMLMHTPLQEATTRERWDMAAALVAFMREDDTVRDWEGLLAERSSVSSSTAPWRVEDCYARIEPHRIATERGE
ncbi:hypothetical protein CYMTET_47344 [Cymbomonas tetramitiformis]|uniref:Uncharacterized protein n=1 Tax=Cymbomonas tetramitiformis TaxID=36881 RepID=A0AAE0BVI8_9CHLO|nr:hypothetical protein CYMTET_47344 [Cymbomonas tetramitiformis]